MPKSPYRNLYDRLISNTGEPENGQACWVWKLQRDRWWYGRVLIYVPGLRGRVKLYAHIVCWLIVMTEPESVDDLYLSYLELSCSGLELDHLCNVPLCINPDHLDPVTPKENSRRREERRRVDYCHC